MEEVEALHALELTNHLRVARESRVKLLTTLHSTTMVTTLLI